MAAILRQPPCLSNVCPGLFQAIELDPRFAKAYGNRGLTLLRLGKTAEAEKDFAECLRLDPNLKADLDRSIQATNVARSQP